jgi:hypothetical protein
MTSSAARERDGGQSPGLRFWAACLLLLIPVYIASIGPAHLMTGFQLNGNLNPSRFSSRGQRLCEVVYWPLCQACERSDLVANSVSRYLDLWRTLCRPPPSISL